MPRISSRKEWPLSKKETDWYITYNNIRHLRNERAGRDGWLVNFSANTNLSSITLNHILNSILGGNF